MVQTNAPNKTEGVAEKNQKFTYALRTLNLTIALGEKSGADNIYRKNASMVQPEFIYVIAV